MLRECIEEMEALVFMSDRAAYTEHEFNFQMTALRVRVPHTQLLDRIGTNRWSIMHFPGHQYNIMTSNSVESMNAHTKVARRHLIVGLMDYFRSYQQWCSTGHIINAIPVAHFLLWTNSSPFASPYFTVNPLWATYAPTIYPVGPQQIWVSPDYQALMVVRPLVLTTQLLSSLTVDMYNTQGQVGPSDEGPTDEGPTDESPTDEGPTDEGPTDDGPTDDGPTDDGPTDDGPLITTIFPLHFTLNRLPSFFSNHKSLLVSIEWLVMAFLASSLLPNS
ncbi:hypothetical protein OSB04_025019 [Centaurea solstitialis]|uniref:Uncharacterized protein n=1 Tax=Centaurea solstitialis TaxID=347529 RepID=A0AA38W3M9_9ASTR|nr:hypothetical protein OSB04_025019 [Centaurea solstitialis]